MLNEGYSSYDLLRVAAHFRRSELEQDLHSRLNGLVADGPFRGMRCLPSAHASTLSPKLLGTYEREIQNDLMKLAYSIDSFLDVGCAEGYYTTGLSLVPNISKVVGVDINEHSLEAARKMAALNGAAHKCAFKANIEDALAMLTGATLIMIDVDGSEINVLDKIFQCSTENLLRRSSFLIETDYHQNGASNKQDIIDKLQRSGFELTKEIKQDPVQRISAFAAKQTHSYLDLAIYGLEGRPLSQSWLLFNRGAQNMQATRQY